MHRSVPARRKKVAFRCLSQILIIVFLVVGGSEVSYASIFSDGFVVYVGDRSDPSDFDPYFNQPKIYRQPRYLRIHKQEEKRQQGIQDYEGQRPIRPHGLQKDK